jgi:hypothetical protein
VTGRSLLALAAVFVVAAAVPAGAVADGDPASDYLFRQDLFPGQSVLNGLGRVPFDGNQPPASTRELSAAIADARRRGEPVKVALIGDRSDLGSVGVLWRRPQEYAHFLAREIAFFHKGPLLVVMPNGYGFWSTRKPRTVSATRDRLAGLPTPSEQDDLATAGTAAVGELTGADDDDTPMRRGVVAAVGALAAAGAVALALRRGSRRRVEPQGLVDADHAELRSRRRGTNRPG